MYPERISQIYRVVATYPHQLMTTLKKFNFVEKKFHFKALTTFQKRFMKQKQGSEVRATDFEPSIRKKEQTVWNKIVQCPRF